MIEFYSSPALLFASGRRLGPRFTQTIARRGSKMERKPHQGQQRWKGKTSTPNAFGINHENSTHHHPVMCAALARASAYGAGGAGERAARVQHGRWRSCAV